MILSLPRIDECIAVKQGLTQWTAEQRELRKQDPGFILIEAEACIALASLTDNPTMQRSLIQDSLRFIEELPTSELRETGRDCIEDLVPARLHATFKDLQSPRIPPKLMWAKRRWAMLTASAIAVILFLGYFKDLWTGMPSHYDATLGVVMASVGDTGIKSAEMGFHPGDIVHFSATLESDHHHRWLLHLNRGTATLLQSIESEDRTSDFRDSFTLDAAQCYEFYVVVSADDPLFAGIPLRTEVPWLSAECAVIQDEAIDDTPTHDKIRNRLLNAVRAQGHSGEVEFHITRFVHLNTPRE